MTLFIFIMISLALIHQKYIAMNAQEEFEIAKIPLHVRVEDAAEFEIGQTYHFIDQPIPFIVQAILSEVDIAVIKVDEVFH